MGRPRLMHVSARMETILASPCDQPQISRFLASVQVSANSGAWPGSLPSRQIPWRIHSWAFCLLSYVAQCIVRSVRRIMLPKFKQAFGLTAPGQSLLGF